MKNPWKKISDVNPQTERGSRRIASDIFGAKILSCLSGVEYQILETVIHFTWGFKKTKAEISYGIFEKWTKRSRQAIINNIKRLVHRRILVKELQLVNHGRPINVYMINKYYDTWIDLNSLPLLTNLDVRLVNFGRRNWSISERKTSQQACTLYNKEYKRKIKGKRKTKSAPTEISATGEKLLASLNIKPPEEDLRKSHKKKRPETGKPVTDDDLEF